MNRRIPILILTLLALAVPASGGGKHCKAAPRECEMQIREMLRGKHYLGVRFEETQYGIRIRDVREESPAAAGGLGDGDLVLAVNGRDMTRAAAKEFKAAILETRKKSDGRLNLLVNRAGQIRRVYVHLGEMPKAEVDKVVAAHLREAHAETSPGN
ncbi:MAG TPA: PDZ domain-containing protein [Thermoanaerobaculia bacterium]|nr:PDZ domain-containing protein [Thermoanaerobaculia bacterium]